MLDDLKMIHTQDKHDALGAAEKHWQQQAGEWLTDQLAMWRPEVPTTKNAAKQLAQELMGRPVVIRSGPKLLPAASSWQSALSQLGSNPGWASRPPIFVEIRSNLELPAADQNSAGSPEVVVPRGDTVHRQLLWAAAYGEIVSIYLALLHGITPLQLNRQEVTKQGTAV